MMIPEEKTEQSQYNEEEYVSDDTQHNESPVRPDSLIVHKKRTCIDADHC